MGIFLEVGPIKQKLRTSIVSPKNYQPGKMRKYILRKKESVFYFFLVSLFKSMCKNHNTFDAESSVKSPIVEVRKPKHVPPGQVMRNSVA